MESKFCFTFKISMDFVYFAIRQNPCVYFHTLSHPFPSFSHFLTRTQDIFVNKRSVYVFKLTLSFTRIMFAPNHLTIDIVIHYLQCFQQPRFQRIVCQLDDFVIVIHLLDGKVFNQTLAIQASIKHHPDRRHLGKAMVSK